MAIVYHFHLRVKYLFHLRVKYLFHLRVKYLFHLRVKYLFHLRVKYHFHLQVKHRVQLLELIRMDLSQPCPYTVLSGTSRTYMFYLNFLLPPKHHCLGLVHLPLLGRFVFHLDCTSLLVTLLHATDARSALLVLAPHTTSLCNMRKTDHSSTQGQLLPMFKRGNAYYHVYLPCIRMCWPSFDPHSLVIPDFFELPSSHKQLLFYHFGLMLPWCSLSLVIVHTRYCSSTHAIDMCIQYNLVKKKQTLLWSSLLATNCCVLFKAH